MRNFTKRRDNVVTNTITEFSSHDTKKKNNNSYDHRFMQACVKKILGSEDGG